MESKSSGEQTLTLDGWSIRAPAGSDPAPLARRVLDAVPSLSPERGEAALGAALPGSGEVQRWRAHRAAILLTAGPLGAVHVKVYRPKDALEVLLEVLLPSRSGTSWRMGRKLAAAGVPTPEPLLLAMKKPFRVHRGSVLLTRPLEDPRLFTDELKRRLAAGEPVRPLLRDVARLAATLHEAGFFHGDFTASNVVVAGPAAARALCVIDLDRAKDLRALPAGVRRWVQCLDLRLLLLTTWAEVPRRQWLRLLAWYGRARNLPRPLRKRLAGRVLAARRGVVRVGARTGTLGGRDPWAR